MKQILSIVLTLFTLFTITGQNVTYEKFAAYGTSSSVSLVSGSTFNITISGFVGNARPYGSPNWAKADVTVGDKVFLSCNQYTIASITGTVPNLVLTITKADASTPTPTNSQVVALIREYADAKGLITYALPQSGDGNGGSTQGVSITLAACINAHYSEVNRLALNTALNTISNGAIDVTKYTGLGVPTFTPTTTDPKLAQSLSSPYPFYAYNGTSWVAVGSGLLDTTLYEVMTRTNADALYLKNTTKLDSNNLKVGGVQANALSQHAIDSLREVILSNLNILNGLTKTNETIKLGGILIEPTVLTSDAINTLSIKGLQPSQLTDQTLTVDINGKVASRNPLQSVTSSFINHIDAGLNSISIGQQFEASSDNTMGLPQGTIIVRRY